MDKANERAIKATEKLNSVKRYQAFYTPVNVIKKMLDFSKLLNSFNNELTILEPTAGIGGIVVEILKLHKQHKVFMVEIEQSSREILQELVDTAPDILTLYEQPNFLQFVNPIEYDMVVMNSPFHLRKNDFTYLDRDYYDIDFVKRAYYMLKNGGELIALVKTENTEKTEFKKWLDNHDCIIHSFEYKDWQASKGNKHSEIKKINLSILILYRDINNKYDNIKEQNKMLNPDLSHKNEVKANNAEYYYGSIDDKPEHVNHFLNQLVGSEKTEYIHNLNLLKSQKKLILYDVKKFLNKWKHDEYNDDSKYLNKFIKQHNLNVYEQK